jgi:hypothetical protein
MKVTPIMLEHALKEERVFRQLAIPLSAFDALQHLKRYHGFTFNIEAITFALLTVADINPMEHDFNELKNISQPT